MRPAGEGRGSAVLAVAALMLLVLGLQNHFRVFPIWASLAGAAVTCLAMAGAALRAGSPAACLAERAIVLVFAVLVVGAAALSLVVLIDHIVEDTPGTSGLSLLTSSVVIWGCNVIGFALLYWQVDGGGPAGRARPGHQADWLFAEMANAAAVPRGWRPGFLDYLFLAFSTATAFSTTDTLPLRPRAKLLMMVQATISLATLAVVASRAINVLGS